VRRDEAKQGSTAGQSVVSANNAGECWNAGQKQDDRNSKKEIPATFFVGAGYLVGRGVGAVEMLQVPPSGALGSYLGSDCGCGCGLGTVRLMELGMMGVPVWSLGVGCGPLMPGNLSQAAQAPPP